MEWLKKKPSKIKAIAWIYNYNCYDIKLNAVEASLPSLTSIHHLANSITNVSKMLQGLHTSAVCPKVCF